MTKYKVGDRLESLSTGSFTILERDGRNLLIKFDSGYVCKTSTNSITSGKGSIKDPYYPQVLGVGYLGAGPYVSRLGAGSKGFLNLPEYSAWINMLQRCYYDKYESRVEGCATYDNIEVDPHWHNFQHFAEWYVPRRKLLDARAIRRPALDKDILAVKGSPKVYSPDTCCLIPYEINGALIGIDNPVGGIKKQSKGYCYTSRGKRIEGYSTTLEEAIEARKKIKQEILLGLVEKYSHVLEDRVKDKLSDWFE